MTLSSFIQERGAMEVAKELDVHFTTVYLWRHGKSFPKPFMLKRLHQISGGKVTYKEIIEHFVGRPRSAWGLK